jgi:hypothetical protein
MKRSNKVLLVVVLVLVVAFGVGQFFAFSNPAPQSEATPSASPTATPAANATQVVAYVPPAPTAATPTESGSCWTNSIAAPFRTDAWRCSVGNAISDPCFQIPGGNDLLCNVNPANPAATSSFVLQLTQPLPAAQVPEGTVPANWAWLVQLSDGTICSPFTGTLPIAQGGISANYGCAPATPGGEGLLIFGDLNASTSPWTAQVGLLSAATSGLPAVTSQETVNVATVWQ